MISCPLNNASLLVWLALARQPHQTHPEFAEQALLGAIQNEEVDPNAEFEGESLLIRTLSRRQTPRSVWTIAHPADQSPLTVTADEAASLALMAKGADPWKSVGSELGNSRSKQWQDRFKRGEGFFALAQATHAWATLEKCLHHPNRPAWESLVPSLCEINELPAIQAAVAAGLDPNWVGEQGVPLIFMCRKLEIVQWLAAKGGDLNRMDGHGRNLLQARDHLRPALNNDERAAWVALLDPGVISPEYVAAEAMKGQIGRLRQVLPKAADQIRWRWAPQGISRPVNLLDMAALSGRQEDSLRNNLLKLKTQWSEPSQELARLATLDNLSFVANRESFTMSMLPAESGDGAQKRPDHLLATIDDKLALVASLPKTQASEQLREKQSFASWLVHANPEDRPRLIRRWAEWMSEKPDRWTQPAFEFLAIKPTMVAALSPWPAWVKNLPAMDQVPFLGAQVMVATCRMSPNQMAFNESVVVTMTKLCRAMNEAGYRWLDEPWAGLGEALKTSPMGPRWRAAMQAQVGMASGPDHTHRRLRMRS